MIATAEQPQAAGAAGEPAAGLGVVRPDPTASTSRGHRQPSTERMSTGRCVERSACPTRPADGSAGTTSRTARSHRPQSRSATPDQVVDGPARSSTTRSLNTRDPTGSADPLGRSRGRHRRHQLQCARTRPRIVNRQATGLGRCYGGGSEAIAVRTLLRATPKVLSMILVDNPPHDGAGSSAPSFTDNFSLRSARLG